MGEPIASWTTRARAALAAALLAGCGAAETPEDQIRALFARAETAVAERDLGALRDMIADDYADARGHAKADVERLLAAQVLRGQAYAWLHVRALQVDDGALASAELLAALARTPIGGLEQLRELRGDVWVFELELVDRAPGDGDWRIRRADWRPATNEDFGL